MARIDKYVLYDKITKKIFTIDFFIESIEESLKELKEKPRFWCLKLDVDTKKIDEK